MLIFLDTEFSNFIQPQLISIGLVSEDNQPFYAELNDFDISGCSDFVKTVVLPQLGKQPELAMDTRTLRQSLSAWLQRFSEFGAVIAYDYSGDWTLFQTALPERPPWLLHKDIYPEINDLVAEQFFMNTGLSDHHALHDAMANRFSYRPRPLDGTRVG
jgi:hypothetical protein